MRKKIEPRQRQDLTPQRIPFDPWEFLLTELRALRRLAPLKKTELPISFFALGTNPIDLLLKPSAGIRALFNIPDLKQKTVVEYLSDLPAHLAAFQQLLAYNLILKDRNTAEDAGIEEQEYIEGEGLTREMRLADRAVEKTNPFIFLRNSGATNNNGTLRDSIKIDVKRFFHFDFDGLSERVTTFTNALETSKVNAIPEFNRPIIGGGVKLLGEIKPLYGEVISRLYDLNGSDISTIDKHYAPFREALGAIAYDLRSRISASKPPKGNGYGAAK